MKKITTILLILMLVSCKKEKQIDGYYMPISSCGTPINSNIKIYFDSQFYYYQNKKIPYTLYQYKVEKNRIIIYDEGCAIIYQRI